MFFDDWKRLSRPTIRPATPSDVKQIARIHVRGWRREYREVLPDEVRKGFLRADAERNWMHLIAGGDSGPYVLVADHAREGVVAFIAAGPEQSELPDYSGEVYALYVEKKYQDSGIGRSLLQEVAQIMSENAQQGLVLWAFSNSPSNEFFRKLGAQEVSRRSRSYGDIGVEETAFGWPDLRQLLEERDASDRSSGEQEDDTAVDVEERDSPPLEDEGVDAESMPEHTPATVNESESES